ncbi:hypothetical protein FHW69_002987 [Luteibacter sp. Sphag1AF]|uniref:carboxypeptidase-like regulatory domain-containing protein n=1 Tax=Luteibacter sp. Sphag1AF TaxID=2587031 RepID=UPI00160AA353|nr:carboxypeptidase-like regulatory domain-containing protein [Luteibacter sp. Sphag1AF]MBB3228352.1 hypothetical protein [Luteibacter sp. Sphag1AF]
MKAIISHVAAAALLGLALMPPIARAAIQSISAEGVHGAIPVPEGFSTTTDTVPYGGIAIFYPVSEPADKEAIAGFIAAFPPPNAIDRANSMANFMEKTWVKDCKSYSRKNVTEATETTELWLQFCIRAEMPGTYMTRLVRYRKEESGSLIAQILFRGMPTDADVQKWSAYLSSIQPTIQQTTPPTAAVEPDAAPAPARRDASYRVTPAVIEQEAEAKVRTAKALARLRGEREYRFPTQTFSETDAERALEKGKSTIKGRACTGTVSMTQINKKGPIYLYPTSPHFEAWAKMFKERKEGDPIPSLSPDAERLRIETRTDKDGYFKFDELKPGTYYLLMNHSFVKAFTASVPFAYSTDGVSSVTHYQSHRGLDEYLYTAIKKVDLKNDGDVEDVKLVAGSAYFRLRGCWTIF